MSIALSGRVAPLTLVLSLAGQARAQDLLTLDQLWAWQEQVEQPAHVATGNVLATVGLEPGVVGGHPAAAAFMRRALLLNASWGRPTSSAVPLAAAFALRPTRRFGAALAYAKTRAVRPRRPVDAPFDAFLTTKATRVDIQLGMNLARDWSAGVAFEWLPLTALGGIGLDAATAGVILDGDAASTRWRIGLAYHPDTKGDPIVSLMYRTRARWGVESSAQAAGQERPPLRGTAPRELVVAAAFDAVARVGPQQVGLLVGLRFERSFGETFLPEGTKGLEADEDRYAGALTAQLGVPLAGCYSGCGWVLLPRVSFAVEPLGGLAIPTAARPDPVADTWEPVWSFGLGVAGEKLLHGRLRIDVAHRRSSLTSGVVIGATFRFPRSLAWDWR